jgi:NAD(P)-dependent dehydrogenase (short-subunit alcohol dehydrogenase family)
MSQSEIHLLKGRVAVVTGAGSGCGQAVALTLAANGVSVCTSDLNPDRADHTAQAVEAAGGSAFGWQADVSNKFQVAGMIEAARDRFGRLDILVHNAHISPQADTLKIDEWEWRRAVDVNLTGAFFCAQLAARVMADEGGGVIVLLVHHAPAGSLAMHTAHAASMAGISQMAGAFAAELEGRGVMVVALDAGDPQHTAQRICDLAQTALSDRPALLSSL